MNNVKRRNVFDSHRPAEHHDGATKDACELLALIYADKPMNQLLSKYAYEGVYMEYFNHRDSRIIQLLISLATAYRLNSWQLDDDVKSKQKGTCVGTLYTDNENDGVDLSIYEACNKIIHAEEIAYQTRKIPKHDLYYIKDEIFTQGTKGKQTWTAVIWPLAFCDAIITMPDPILHDMPF